MHVSYVFSCCLEATPAGSEYSTCFQMHRSQLCRDSILSELSFQSLSGPCLSSHSYCLFCLLPGGQVTARPCPCNPVFWGAGLFFHARFSGNLLGTVCVPSSALPMGLNLVLLPIVSEASGIIVSKHTMVVPCQPFLRRRRDTSEQQYPIN